VIERLPSIRQKISEAKYLLAALCIHLYVYYDLSRGFTTRSSLSVWNKYKLNDDDDNVVDWISLRRFFVCPKKLQLSNCRILLMLKVRIAIYTYINVRCKCKRQCVLSFIDGLESFDDVVKRRSCIRLLGPALLHHSQDACGHTVELLLGNWRSVERITSVFDTLNNHYAIHITVFTGCQTTLNTEKSIINSRLLALQKEAICSSYKIVHRVLNR